MKGENIHMNNKRGHRINLIGQRFHSLVVVEAVFVKDMPAWRCKCDCGGEWIGESGKLRCGLRAPSMGCVKCRQARINAGCTKHGGCAGGVISRLWSIWSCMRDRCGNPRSKVYQYYGGKGVKICPEWAGFAGFSAWAHSHGYAESLSIDRINSNGNYEPSNCEWVTRSENCRRANIGREYRGGKVGGMKILARAAAAMLGNANTYRACAVAM